MAKNNGFDEETLLLVYGFIREFQDKLSQIVPDGILKLCGEFYFVNEYFAHYGASWDVDSDGMIITKRTSSRQNAFGNIAVHSMSGMVHCWRFEVLHENTCMSFGIAASIDTKIDDEFSKNKESPNYSALHAGHRMSRSKLSSGYDFRIKEGTVVKMELDFGREMLTFYTDDKCC